MIINTLYTLGYTGIPFALLKEACERVNLAVVDIRYSPSSRSPIWRKAYLWEHLGEKHYTALKELGNVNYKGGDIQIADPDTGVPQVVAHLRQRSVILLCACAEVDTCHRKVVADLVKQACGCDVKHLTKADLEAWTAPVQTFDVLPNVDLTQRAMDGAGVPEKLNPLQLKLF